MTNADTQIQKALVILVEAMAVNADIEAMKAANQERLRRALALAYNEEAFDNRASTLRSLADRLRELDGFRE